MNLIFQFLRAKARAPVRVKAKGISILDDR